MQFQLPAHNARFHNYTFEDLVFINGFALLFPSAHYVGITKCSLLVRFRIEGVATAWTFHRVIKRLGHLEYKYFLICKDNSFLWEYASIFLVVAWKCSFLLCYSIYTFYINSNLYTPRPNQKGKNNVKITSVTLVLHCRCSIDK